jgi:hypothetical protein
MMRSLAHCTITALEEFVNLVLIRCARVTSVVMELAMSAQATANTPRQMMPTLALTLSALQKFAVVERALTTLRPVPIQTNARVGAVMSTMTSAWMTPQAGTKTHAQAQAKLLHARSTSAAMEVAFWLTFMVARSATVSHATRIPLARRIRAIWRMVFAKPLTCLIQPVAMLMQTPALLMITATDLELV